MSELGSRLREARVNKGYTLNTLQQMTKIQKKYLQAIEEGQLEELPGTFYARAFVKQYADMVGLDGDTLLREYESELEVKNTSETIHREETEEMPSRLKTYHLNGENNQLEKMLSYLPMAILSVIIICIIFILIFAMRQISMQDKQETLSDQSDSNVVEVVKPSATPVGDSTEEVASTQKVNNKKDLADNQLLVGKEVITDISQPGEIKTYQLEGPIENYQFGAEGKAFVWLGVYEDNNMVLDQTINKDEKIEHQAKDTTQSVRLELGYPEGAQFMVNGKVVEADPSVPSVIVFKIKDQEATSSEEIAIEELTESNEETSFQGPAVLDPNYSSGE
ncbi:helix-turn-helix domain-containing protein [Facklamia miroungae]|uniref:Helix-turn-helix domain-containing protein n=1 Tax=Facklamia miroungae TaxID=120956 RepID=A0A1G7PNZ8_9LACT|nr:helix-turn-helix domain-containing protein [Facklamia miroungae]NKZ28778.1 helix-turn-helix domain-containing protein [Facklamia miroungae]SDF87977.1 Helix-turn-helix domain-containing protein [Facklamia miroungae]